MELINKTFHTEFEVVRLKSFLGEEIDTIYQHEYSSEITLGTYILIKKEFRKKIMSSLQTLYISDELRIHYKKLFSTYIDDNQKICISTFINSQYHRPSWSAKYKYSSSGKVVFVDEVIFANIGPFEIEKTLENKGLGSYMIDSLIVWAKQNYGNANIKISIGFSSDTEEEKKKIYHFYGKRKIERDVKIKETQDYLDATDKTERINYEEFIEKLLHYTINNTKLLNNCRNGKLYLNENLLEVRKREKIYQISITVLSITILILIFLVKNKFI